jgi:peptide/nickel transport system ATP-binding protein
MATLEIQNLSFWHNKKAPLFKNFSLSVAHGEIVGIVGKSGSGKSSLLDLVAGILKPKSGTIISAKPSFIFQDPYSSFHPSYPIQTQIKDVIGLNLLDEDMLESKLNLDRSLLKRYPHELSGGQLQRFSIFRAFSMKAGVMLADEPTSALDNVTQLEVMKLLVGLRSEFATLLVTHDMDLAKWACDAIIDISSETNNH